jgi:hypothetical protein
MPALTSPLGLIPGCAGGEAPLRVQILHGGRNADSPDGGGRMPEWTGATCIARTHLPQDESFTLHKPGRVQMISPVGRPPWGPLDSVCEAETPLPRSQAPLWFPSLHS